MPPPHRDARGRMRSARSQASRTPEEDQVQHREISYSPVSEQEEDVQERTGTQDVPYINESRKRIESKERNESRKRNESETQDEPKKQGESRKQNGSKG